MPSMAKKKKKAMRKKKTAAAKRRELEIIIDEYSELEHQLEVENNRLKDEVQFLRRYIRLTLRLLSSSQQN